jgi:hypothetical protein
MSVGCGKEGGTEGRREKDQGRWEMRTNLVLLAVASVRSFLASRERVVDVDLKRYGTSQSGPLL